MLHCSRSAGANTYGSLVFSLVDGGGHDLLLVLGGGGGDCLVVGLVLSLVFDLRNGLDLSHVDGHCLLALPVIPLSGLEHRGGSRGEEKGGDSQVLHVGCLVLTIDMGISHKAG